MSKASEVRAAIDQSTADSLVDQTAVDQNETLASRDQVASDSDQRSADQDQDASDQDLAAGGNPVTHRHSRLARRRTSHSREETSALREERGAGPLRDDVAQTRHLRVLVADEGRDRLENLGEVVSGLGHEVVARVVEAKDVSAITARERPDVALVWVAPSANQALELIDEIVHKASCPVIALLPTQDSASVREAANHGIFAYIVETGPEELQSAIDITLQRFAEYHDLQGAFGRRAVIEQAKGMLMARHGINDAKAFELLRKQSQHGGGRLSDVATAVVTANSLMPPGQPDEGEHTAV